jgi:phosphotransferase family enzyme
MSTRPDMPTRPDHLTPEWLAACLQYRSPGVRIAERRFIGDHVSWASKFRVTVRYADENAHGDLPDQFCIKASLDNPNRPDDGSSEPGPFDRLWVSEGRFYRDLAPTLDVTMPKTWYADTDDRRSAVVIMEDLVAAGCTFGSFDRPLSADAVAAVLEQAARLHARWWGDEQMLGQPFLADILGPIFAALVAPANWDAVLPRPRCAQMPEWLRDRDTVTRAVRKMVEHEEVGPHCVVHGDLHIGNLYFSGNTVGLLDFQVVSRGRPAADVAYLLTGAMSTIDRRVHERDLIEHYRQALAARIDPAPSWNQLWLDYRRRQMHGVMNFFTPGNADQSEEYKATVGGRFAAAAQDLDTLEALGVTV